MRLVSRLPGNWRLLAASNQNATVSGCPHLYNKRNTISNKMCDNPENVRPTGHQFRRLTQIDNELQHKQLIHVVLQVCLMAALNWGIILVIILYKNNDDIYRKPIHIQEKR
jgi:hypothetical protein